MAHDGASGVEIAHALDLKAQGVRAKLNSLGIRLRRRVRATRLRMVISISRRMRLAADARGVTVQQLIKRLLQVISRDNLFDTILPLPVPHSLGAAAVHETPTTAGSGAGVAAVASAPAAFCIVLKSTASYRLCPAGMSAADLVLPFFRPPPRTRGASCLSQNSSSKTIRTGTK